MSDNEKFEVGDIVGNDDTGLKGVVKTVNEDSIVIEWVDDENNVSEETIQLDNIEEKTEADDGKEKKKRFDRKELIRKKIAKNLANMKNVKEETEAASSLHPAAKSVSDPDAVSSSKVGVMKSVMGLVDKMGGDEMIDFFNKVQAQFGPGKSYGVGDVSGSNQNSLDMKASDAVGKGSDKVSAAPMPHLVAKEDLNVLFGDYELSEDFKEKATVIFEAALNARFLLEKAELEEAFEEAYDTMLDEELTEISEALVEKTNGYLDYIVEEWMTENEVAVESTLRNEIMEEFIDGLKTLFDNHYIDVPESKIDVVETLADKVNELQNMLDNAISENNELKDLVSEEYAKNVFEDLSSDLVVTQQEKFAKLAEGIEFDGDVEKYANKLTIIKEKFFKKPEGSHTTYISEETFDGDETNGSVKPVNPDVNRYIQAIEKKVKYTS